MAVRAGASYRSGRSSASYGSPLVVLGILLALGAHAQTPTTLLNEVLYDPSGTDTGFEWAELYNPSGSSVDLGGWRIERAGSRFETAFTFPAGAAIAAGGYLVVGESSVQEADLVGSLAFQNGGSATDGIRLVDAAGAAVDVLLYDTPNTNRLADETGSAGTSFAPDAASGNGLARIPNGADTNASADDWQEMSTLTPGTENVVPTPTPSPTLRPAPTGVVVNEALPDPVGSDTSGEFIELLNTTGSTVGLTGAQLDDADGGSAAYAIPDGTTIGAGAILVFSRSETGIALNNDGDSARLIAEDGTVVSALVFGASPQEGAAWARKDDGSAEWTSTATSGAANTFTPITSGSDEAEASPTPSPTTKGATTTAAPALRTVALADIRSLPVKTRVRTSGVVSAPPGVLGKGVFYLSGSGLQVFVSGGDPPTLAVGDLVSLEGTVSSVRGETRLRVRASALRKVSAASPPVPTDVATGSVDETLEGHLVRIRGTVVRLAGNSFLVDDGSGPARVLVKKTTGWTRPRLARGQRVSVVGIVSQSGETYRLLPRFLRDLVIEQPLFRSSAGAQEVVEEASATEEPPVREAADTVEPAGDVAGAATGPPAPSVPEPPRNFPLLAIISWSAAGALGVVKLFLRRS